MHELLADSTVRSNSESAIFLTDRSIITDRPYKI